MVSAGPKYRNSEVKLYRDSIKGNDKWAPGGTLDYCASNWGHGKLKVPSESKIIITRATTAAGEYQTSLGVVYGICCGAACISSATHRFSPIIQTGSCYRYSRPLQALYGDISS